MYIKVNRKKSDIIAIIPSDETTLSSNLKNYIKNIKIKDSIIELAANSLSELNNVAGEINLNNVEVIGSAALANSSFSKVVVNKNVSLGEACFAGMSNLETVELKDGGELNHAVFAACSNIKNIDQIIGFEKTTLNPLIKGTTPVSDDMFGGVPLEGSVTIPLGWDFLPVGCFADTNINEVILHDGIDFDQVDWGGCFSGCTLDSLIIPNKAGPFNNRYLAGVTVKGDIILPNLYTSVADNIFYSIFQESACCDRFIFASDSPITSTPYDCFAWTNFREIIFPEGLITCGSYASNSIARFPGTVLTEFGGMMDFKHLVLSNTVPPTITGEFYIEGFIAVPDDVVDTYKAAARWSDHADKIISQTVFNAMHLSINVPLHNGYTGEELELNIQSKLINKFTEPYPTNIRINVSIDSVPGGATAHLWYRDGINPDVDVAVLGYIPPELGESVDEFGRPFTKVFEEPGDKFDLPLYLDGDTEGNYTITFTLVSGAETLSSCTTTFRLDVPFAFKINTYGEESSYNPEEMYEPSILLEGGPLATSFTGRLEVTADLSGLTGSMANLEVMFGDSSWGFLTTGVMVPVQYQDNEMEIFDPVITVDGWPYNDTWNRVRFNIGPAGDASGSFTITINLVNTDTSTIVTSKVMTFNITE